MKGLQTYCCYTKIELCACLYREEFITSLHGLPLTASPDMLPIRVLISVPFTASCEISYVVNNGALTKAPYLIVVPT